MDEQNFGADPSRESLLGRTLGDYRIEHRIGGGATSDVFLATQISLGRRVALKILKDELNADEKYARRFLQEARAAARLEHPNIARVYEVGELVDEPRGKFFWRSRARSRKTYRFIAQEYVGGTSLAQYLRLRGAATIMQTFSAIEQIALALKRASSQNIVHRDVKPENVLIDPEGVLKVVDFGLARSIDSDDTTLAATALTRAGVALGTPLYMSPEQARGGKLDARSDFYSLGVTAYRMLAGKAPFYAETPLAVVLKHINEPPRPISELRPDVPEGLAKLIHRALEKDPDARPGSADELLEELRTARREYVAALRSSENECEFFTEGKKDAENKFSSEELEKSGASAPLYLEREEVGFFQSPEERLHFESDLRTTNLSREWRASAAKLEEARRRGRLDHWRPSGIALALGLFLSFGLGGVVLGLRNRAIASLDREPPVATPRCDDPEEQFVCALQTNTAGAWKSALEYFPEDSFWTPRFERQYAYALVEEFNVEEAEKAFKTISGKGALDAKDPYPEIGAAWVLASRGEFESASALLSGLDGSKGVDGLCRGVLDKTRRLIAEKCGWNSAYLKPFNRFAFPNGRGTPSPNGAFPKEGENPNRPFGAPKPNDRRAPNEGNRSVFFERFDDKADSGSDGGMKASAPRERVDAVPIAICRRRVSIV